MPEKKSPKKQLEKINFKQEFISQIKNIWVTRFFYDLIQTFKEIFFTLKTTKKMAQNNYELGRRNYDQGAFEDAIFRFRLQLWFDEKDANGWYWLGRSYYIVGKKPNARNSFKKALQLNPDWPEAKEALRIASEVKVEERASQESQ